MSSHTGDAGSVEVEPMPGYLELISRASAVMLDAWRDCGGCGPELSRRTLLENAYITCTEIALFFFCAFLWTQVRRGLTESLFKSRSEKHDTGFVVKGKCYPFSQKCLLSPDLLSHVPVNSGRISQHASLSAIGGCFQVSRQDMDVKGSGLKELPLPNISDLQRLAERAGRRGKPLAQWWRLMPKDAAKMPESAWKLVFYTMSWSYSTYLLFFTSYSFFHDPPSVFYNWKSGMSVPTDIAIAYLIQGSFYGHSIYATIYMDAWRKDSAVMVVHHIITLALISFSYAFRYHNVGILVLFLHDINDIQLEFTKLNVYLKSRGGGYYLLNDVLSNMFSISFSITWFWFRLYWFPLKVLYATCVSSLQSVPSIPFYFFFNALLLVLLLMNIYWFLFIVVFVVKVLKLKEVNDVREYEDEDASTAAAGLLRNPQAENNDDGAGHHISAQG
ncbi:hypothetical protein L3Q82_025748 [Scortum barcoo]|uniref:Uncharacterized protein n=1 Tax=Scortum barcoo TaxID=214431 RepID=A0ACB8WL16_9TELE|nr:hypothetical protein L3Q82_025748 [Scortum barcoo]